MGARELLHLAVAYLCLSFAFAAAVTGRVWLLRPFSLPAITALWEPFRLALLALGPSFILHELAHRTVARANGVAAEFRLSWFGTAICVILATFTGILFGAVGGVVVETVADEVLTGKIAAAGPLTNLLLIPVFWLVGGRVGTMGVFINSVLSFFNLLPFSPLDGEKIARWSRIIWMILFVIAVSAYTHILTTIR
jgi:Zn-dependent protease